MYYISHMANTLPSPHTYSMHPHYQVLVGILIVVMFSLNVAFIVDLTINHQAHSKHSYNGTSPTALQAHSPQPYCTSCVFSAGHLRTVLGNNRGENTGEDGRGREMRGETAVKQFINLHVKSKQRKKCLSILAVLW